MDMPLGTDDLSGKVFGRLTALSYAGSSKDGSTWLCQCACGAQKVVPRERLRKGRTKSCGCLSKEARTAVVDGVASSRHPLYSTWTQMRARCRNPADGHYAGYGGRGITVDPRWDDFAQFVADMGPKPSPRHTVDRKDNDGPYSPENCQWATPMAQAGNRRGRDPHVDIAGEELPLSKAAEKLGVTVEQVRAFMGLSAQGAIDLIARTRRPA